MDFSSHHPIRPTVQAERILACPSMRIESKIAYGADDFGVKMQPLRCQALD